MRCYPWKPSPPLAQRVRQVLNIFTQILWYRLLFEIRSQVSHHPLTGLFVLSTEYENPGHIPGCWCVAMSIRLSGMDMDTERRLDPRLTIFQYYVGISSSIAKIVDRGAPNPC